MENPKLKQLSEEWLIETTVDEMQQKMNNNELTSKDLVLMYLNRIAKFDQHGPKINSVLEINPDALQIASALDSERKVSGPRGPMHGIPVLIKDNIDTNDKMHTSAGSLALENSYALEDSFVVEKLRSAGAVILGKTNMTEWANFMAEGMPSGYSSRGGQVLNPYGPGDFVVGGSSSGSGAAIASNFAAVAVGTETSGSILSPASQNSLVGIKPTVGLISRRGIIPIAHTQDTAGPMARTVRDAVHLLNALIGPDEEDPITLTNTALSSVDFTTYLEVDGLRGKRIGIAREKYFDYLGDEKIQVMNEAVQKLSELGAEVVDNVIIPSTNRKWSYDVLTYEFKTDLNAYLKNLHSSYPIRSLKNVIEFNNQHKDKMLKYGQVVLLEAEETSGTLTEKAYIKAIEEDYYHSTENGIDSAMKEHNLDAIVFPNNYGASIPAKAGYPSITVPAGYSNAGEPIGITFTGQAYCEPILISIAYSFEQGIKVRKAPKW
ncbi:amidase family protein [Pseudoneobacillus rhizosphaerae]|uniref:Glutamyl-tRNA(Gln) amidotransferase subunit A n=1 Tax=Pseudoneobacillus rhizosphaerae TaxID=2880968 RepID=A0A9C7G7M5_9BACI|nr:amidase family protein [Pseudoneobacillus rhizosphaerae]CAG9607241.1 Glutamyl-tRNA(Gln) amidotransferase subunit A [Pseudoneobacillus rhizosphaerae]